MLQEFINFYLEKANYEFIDNGKTYYAEIPALKGIWATGKNLEECRRNLLETLEGWVILRLKKNLSIPNFKVPFVKMDIEKVAGTPKIRHIVRSRDNLKSKTYAKRLSFVK